MDNRAIGSGKNTWTKDDHALNLAGAEIELGLTNVEKKSPE
jgi:hypothetical protein